MKRQRRKKSEAKTREETSAKESTRQTAKPFLHLSLKSLVMKQGIGFI